MNSIRLGGLLIITTLLAIILNFNSILQGSAAGLLNVLVTIAFLGVWIFVFWYAVKYNFSLVFSFVIFWCIALLITLVTILINIYDMTINFIIPFVILFLTPLYGIRVLGDSYVLALMIMAFVSICFIAYGLYGIIKAKKIRY